MSLYPPFIDIYNLWVPQWRPPCLTAHFPSFLSFCFLSFFFSIMCVCWYECTFFFSLISAHLCTCMYIWKARGQLWTSFFNSCPTCFWSLWLSLGPKAECMMLAVLGALGIWLSLPFQYWNMQPHVWLLVCVLMIQLQSSSVSSKLFNDWAVFPQCFFFNSFTF